MSAIALAVGLASACAPSHSSSKPGWRVEKKPRKKPPAPKNGHANHEHAHGDHPHGLADHHHHAHPHPHLDGPDGHHHPF